MQGLTPWRNISRIYNHTQDATHMAAESAAIRHAWQRHSKLLLDEHDSGIEQTAIHDAQVSGKADRYSARMTAAEQAAIRHAFQTKQKK